MKSFILITSLTLLACIQSYAQKHPSSRYIANSTYKETRCFGITLTTGMAAETNIRGTDPAFTLNSAPRPVFEALLQWYRELDTGWWLVLGAGGGGTEHNFRYHIPKESAAPALPYDLFNTGMSGEMTGYLKASAEVERRWPDRKQNLWNINLGAGFLYSSPMESGYTDVFMYNGAEYTYLRREQSSSSTAWFQLQAAGGYSWKFRNKHLLRANLKIAVSLKDYIKGDYRFTLPGQPEVTGTYEVSGSYIGVGMGYIFAR